MVRGWDQAKYVYNEMPDFTLGVLQDRFDKKSLEDLYKKYEQRYQLSESFFFLFDNKECKSTEEQSEADMGGQIDLINIILVSEIKCIDI